MAGVDETDFLTVKWASSRDAADSDWTLIDEFKTEFSFPGEAFGRGYVIKLYDPVTGEEIYRAPTKFNKD